MECIYILFFLGEFPYLSVIIILSSKLVEIITNKAKREI